MHQGQRRGTMAEGGMAQWMYYEGLARRGTIGASSLDITHMSHGDLPKDKADGNASMINCLPGHTAGVRGCTNPGRDDRHHGEGA